MLNCNWKSVVSFLITSTYFSAWLSVGLSCKAHDFFSNWAFHVYIVSPSHLMVNCFHLELGLIARLITCLENLLEILFIRT